MNDKNETPKIIRLVETDSTNNYLREQSAKARLPERGRSETHGSRKLGKI